MDDLARFCCQNSDCTHYGRRDAGNLSVCGRYGKHKQSRRLYCNACRARFSERKGTPPDRCRLPEETAVAVFDHLAEGNGIRQTSRLVGVQPNPVVPGDVFCSRIVPFSNIGRMAIPPSPRGGGPLPGSLWVRVACGVRQ
jgi:transposase-like protein